LLIVNEDPVPPLRLTPFEPPLVIEGIVPVAVTVKITMLPGLAQLPSG
jgi:hypothetical protein